MQKTAIIILAAGASQRMGRIKQLLPWKRTTLLGNAILQAKEIKNVDVFTVLGANALKIKEKINFKGTIVLQNPEWNNGLGNSLAFAVSEIDNNDKEYTSILVLLADQPLIDSDYLNALLNLFHASDKNIAATQYAKEVGVPAIFSAQYFKVLKTLNADFGAKALLKKYDNDLVCISSEGKERDIDTWEDYQSFIDKYSNI